MLHHARDENPNVLSPVSMADEEGPKSPAYDVRRKPSGSSTVSHARKVSEDASTEDRTGSTSPRMSNQAFKREGEPPRNSQGVIICTKPQCNSRTFPRKCEWSKHMDKHERPYKCLRPGCEKLQGFTYSGGLLRHEREVHKLHGGTEKALYCPHRDCKRHSGAGFTRKENLHEHLRRVHRRTSGEPESGAATDRDEREEASVESPAALADEAPPFIKAVPSKRKRVSSGIRDQPSGPGGETEESGLRAEVKRLREDNEAKDRRLQALEDAVERLTRHQSGG